MKDRLFRLFMWGCALIFVVGIGSNLAVVIWIFHLLDLRNMERQANCAQILSTPLTTEVTTSLCQRGLIPASLGSCLLPDFQIHVEDVGTIFRENIQTGKTSYQEVTDMFGEFTRYCEEKNDSRSEFRCDYDISGRGQHALVYFDNTTEIVRSVRITGCGGGS